jgi:hypothetical protein
VLKPGYTITLWWWLLTLLRQGMQEGKGGVLSKKSHVPGQKARVLRVGPSRPCAAASNGVSENLILNHDVACSSIEHFAFAMKNIYLNQ